MVKKTITYTDYNGTERTEDFYFHLSDAEIAEMNFTSDGTLSSWLERMIKENNMKRLYEMFKNIILKAYGEKSEDGRRFIKSEQASLDFTQTEAFSELMMSFFDEENPTAASDFINALINKDSKLRKLQA